MEGGGRAAAAAAGGTGGTDGGRERREYSNHPSQCESSETQSKEENLTY